VASRELQDGLESRLSKGLVDFIHTETHYSIRRLLPGDLKILYTGPDFSEEDPISSEENPFDSTFMPKANEKHGGTDFTGYLTCNCLIDDEIVRLEWTCQLCNHHAYGGSIDRIRHLAACTNEKEKEESKILSNKDSEESSNKDSSFFCEKCQKTLNLRSTDILRHKRNCTG